MVLFLLLYKKLIFFANYLYKFTKLLVIFHNERFIIIMYEIVNYFLNELPCDKQYMVPKNTGTLKKIQSF